MGFGPDDFTQSLEDAKAQGQSELLSALGIDANTTVGPAVTLPPIPIPGKTTAIEEARWDKMSSYSFYVGEVGSDGKVKGQAASAGPMNSTRVTLAIPPQSLNVQVQFASSVVATNKGVLEENNGVVFRTISMSGTTGIIPSKAVRNRPSAPKGLQGVANALFPAATSAINTFVSSASKVLGSVTAPTNPPVDLKATGYYQFWLLHNFFIEYAEMKKQGHPEMRLIFASGKDNISYVCTPVSFDLRRDASQPLLYRYQIVLRCWEVVDSTFNALNLLEEDIPSAHNILSVKKVLDRIRRARNAIQSASNVIRGVQSDIFDIMNTVNQGVLALKDVAGVGNQLIDFLPTIKNNLNLLIVTNKNQWSQIISDRQEAYAQYGKSHDAIATLGTDISNGLKSAVGISGKTALEVAAVGAAAGATVALATSSSSRKAGPTGESVSEDNASPKGTLAISPLLDHTELSDDISIDELGSLPASVQSQIDAQKQIATDTSAGQVRALAAKLTQVSDNLSYTSGTMDATYAATFGLPAPTAATRPPTEDDIILMAQVEDAKDAFLSTLATGDLFPNRQNDPFTEANKAIPAIEQLETPISSFIANVERGATLERIAQVFMGDPARAREIAILNDLRAPYIDEVGFTLPVSLTSGRTLLVNDRSNLAMNQVVRIGGSLVPETRRTIVNIENVGNSSFRITVNGTPNLDIYTPGSSPYLKARLPGCVGSGDTILIPSGDTPDQVANSRPTSLSDKLTFAEKIFGVDVALSKDGDLDIGPSGDAGRSYGYQNAVQALRLLLETERGELEWHLEYGFDAAIGQRFTSDLNTLISSRVKSAITSDPRFVNANVTVTRESTAFLVQVEAIGRQGTGRIPVEFRVPIPA